MKFEWLRKDSSRVLELTLDQLILDWGSID